MKSIEAKEYDEEKILQEMIMQQPEVLSIPFSNKLVSLCTEYPVVNGWIDLLCVGDEGRIYIIEAKLQKNIDKRKVIAQVLEYASQIALHDTFETFKAKIEKRVGKSLKEILGEFGDEEGLRKSFNQKTFSYVIVMDTLEEHLKDTIIFLNRKYSVGILGVELHRHVLNDYSEIFVPQVIGVESSKEIAEQRFVSLVSEDDLRKSYSEKGLGEEINGILTIFKDACEKDNSVKITGQSRYLVLSIGNEVDVSFKVIPDGDHGVWVKNAKLFDNVSRLGKKLGFTVSDLDRSKKAAKVIVFNGIEGVKQASQQINELVAGLVEIYKNSLG